MGISISRDIDKYAYIYIYIICINISRDISAGDANVCRGIHAYINKSEKRELAEQGLKPCGQEEGGPS